MLSTPGPCVLNIDYLATSWLQRRVEGLITVAGYCGAGTILIASLQLGMLRVQKRTYGSKVST